MKQGNIGKIKDMTVDTMKQHTMNRCDITREDKTDGKIGDNKRESMQHILQTKEKNGKNRREKINEKEKRENMQHILQIPKRMKNEESESLHRISHPRKGG